MLRERALRDNDMTVLDEAVRQGESGLRATAHANPAWPARASNLAMSLRTRARSGTDVQAAVDLLRGAVASAQPADPERVGFRANLGLCLRTLFEHTGRPEDLDEAVECLTTAMAATPRNTSVVAGRLGDLAHTLTLRYKHRGDRADLLAATTALRRALAAAGDSDQRREGLVATLVEQLHLLFEAYENSGEGADLDEAVLVGRALVREQIPGSVPFVRTVIDLCVLLTSRSRLTSSVADAGEAIDMACELLDLESCPRRPLLRSTAGHAYFARYKLTRSERDLDSAITQLEHALREEDSTKLDVVAVRNGLAVALRARFQQSAHAADLDAAILQADLALAATPDAGRRASIRLNSATALLLRFELAGRRSDLDAAIGVGLLAAAAVPTDDPRRTVVDSHLALAYHARAKLDIDAAVGDLAIQHLRDAARAGGTVHARLSASQGWGVWAAEAGDADSARQGFELAVELLPQAAWIGLSRPDRESQLRRWSTIAADAAGTLIAADDTARAVESLEATRSVLWQQRLQLHTLPGRVAAQDPVLAGRLRAVAESLLLGEQNEQLTCIAADRELGRLVDP
ncbi:hypothetical protein IU510_30240 [Nocardia cyriacigeorgica]|uniref:hypothetical protein n=1 Tax=Nocardia cyriacigeorgica TaxID=135487 RepID=UPI0018957F2D|nr:hypothetical protein [Nocardia cyriacigeorgica]MBF6102302.1 hypothetical protein [Nocardia cyriacigeorgica]